MKSYYRIGLCILLCILLTVTGCRNHTPKGPEGNSQAAEATTGAADAAMDDITLEADSRVDEGDKLHLGKLEFIVIHTPGHTRGGTSLYCEKEGLVFSGDTLFKGTWGRTDLPTSSLLDIMDSITKKLLVLPEETIVYPGHGKITRIREEKPIYLNLKPRLEY